MSSALQPESQAKPIETPVVDPQMLESLSIGGGLRDIAALSHPPVKFDEIVNLRDLLAKDPVRAMQLFERGFEIYCDCFPDPNERESKENLLQYLKDPEMNWQMYLAVSEGQVIADEL